MVPRRRGVHYAASVVGAVSRDGSVGNDGRDDVVVDVAEALTLNQDGSTGLQRAGRRAGAPGARLGRRPHAGDGRRVVARASERRDLALRAAAPGGRGVGRRDGSRRRGAGSGTGRGAARRGGGGPSLRRPDRAGSGHPVPRSARGGRRAGGGAPACRGRDCRPGVGSAGRAGVPGVPMPDRGRRAGGVRLRARVCRDGGPEAALGQVPAHPAPGKRGDGSGLAGPGTFGSSATSRSRR